MASGPLEKVPEEAIDATKHSDKIEINDFIQRHYYSFLIPIHYPPALDDEHFQQELELRGWRARASPTSTCRPPSPPPPWCTHRRGKDMATW